MFSISEGLLFGLLIIPILAFLILAHEFGHFLAARSVGVTVEEFGIGLPPRAKGWRWKGVLWSLNWIPFGGFVRVKGEDAADTDPGSMNTKSPWQRGWFLLAGPIMNFLVAIVLSIVLVAFQGLPSQSSQIYIGQVAEGSPAFEAGWQPGDAIIAVDGTAVTSGTQLRDLITQHAGSKTEVTIQRGEKQLTTTVTPRQNPPANQGATGITMSEGINSTVSIRTVASGSPAEKAGLQSGDRVTAINGVRIDSWLQAQNMLASVAGSTVPMTVHRGGTDVNVSLTVPELTIQLSAVATNSPAANAGLYPGDRITSIGGMKVSDGVSFQQALIAASGKSVQVEYFRNVDENGTVTSKKLTSALAVPTIGENDNPVETIGVNAAQDNPFTVVGTDVSYQNVFDRVSAARVVPEGWNQFWGIVTGTADGLQRMATQGVNTSELAGPVGMGQLTSELLTRSAAPKWVTLVQITTFISVSLSVLNLLPLPALDGGRLLFVIVEILRGGKKIAPEKEGMVHLAGMVILLGLMFFIAFGDVQRLFSGNSLLP
ncbi:MAG: RIP metalloprotease RseP [Thermomicrobiales bacterium]